MGVGFSVVDITLDVDANQLTGGFIEFPKPGEFFETPPIYLIGWALGRHEPATHVEIAYNGAPQWHIPLRIGRPEVREYYPDAPGDVQCGYELPIELPATDASVLLTFTVLLHSGGRATLGSILLRQQPLAARASAGADGAAYPVVIQRHAYTWVPLTDLRGFDMAYQSTWGTERYINAHHAALTAKPKLNSDGIAMIDKPIPGWLRLNEALKLYEMAYYCPGDILEIGSYQGLSATIMSGAIRDSGRPRQILSLDISIDYIRAARGYVDTYGAGEYVQFLCCDARDAVDWLSAAGRRFAFIFVDHSHTYEDVALVCRQLNHLVSDGGFVLFHDFNDPRNADAARPDYGVSTAVVDSLPADAFDFYGIYDGTALYRKRRQLEVA